MRFSLSILRLLAVVFLLGGCATPTHKVALSPTEAHLVGLMKQRLEIARQVAWIKFQNHTPVRDKKRESELLSALTEQGTKLGLSVKGASGFFRAQIAASCAVQRELIYRWSRGATLPAVAPLDLRTQIRPELDRISGEMVCDLAALKGGPLNSALRAQAQGALRQAGFSWYAAWIAAGPL